MKEEAPIRARELAVVGYGYRLPGGLESDEDFWNLLSSREIVQEPIRERYGRGFQPIGENSGIARLASPFEGLVRGGKEHHIDLRLFGLSRAEASLMDPQAKMLLNSSWEALEMAGLSMQKLRNSRTGVYIGSQVGSVTNWRRLLGPTEFMPSSVAMSMLANRVSYQFNLMGPSATFATACSSGLTALDAAMSGIVTGDCDQAVVGATNYLGSPGMSAGFNCMGVLSPHGKCYSFDVRANGYVRSEGAVAFVLKPLEAAERDRDRILAVILSTAVNTAGTADGALGINAGRYISAPTTHSQVEVMLEACKRAGIKPESLDYLEAHATGTTVGDRIEGRSIIAAYGSENRRAPLRISSVKSNVGHMEAAAFTCSLLKVLLMLQHRTFAPISRNYMAPSSEIDFSGSNVEVQVSTDPFPDHPVSFGINSFGFGGTNGHCIVREYRSSSRPVYSVPVAPDSGYMIPLSARTADAVVQSAESLKSVVEFNKPDLYTLAGNLSLRRTHYSARAAFAVRNSKDLLCQLDEFLALDELGPIAICGDSEPRIAMVFPGQGTQWHGCGKMLYDANPVFRRTVDAIEKHWRKHANYSLKQAAFTAKQRELDQVQFAQPVIFMLQCALTELFKTWGVYPDCVVGHSSGEVAAAYASGALSLEDAVQLVYHRSVLQTRTAGSGRMLAIGNARKAIESILDDLGISYGNKAGNASQVEFACANSPVNHVVCGKERILRKVEGELRKRNFDHSFLRGNIAFHSSAMEVIRDDARHVFSFLDDRKPNSAVPFISTVSGIETEVLDSAYWWNNIRQTVRFADAMDTLKKQFRPQVILEIGPHAALQPLVRQCMDDLVTAPESLHTLLVGEDEIDCFNNSLCALYRSGISLDFDSQYPATKNIVHTLPGHPKNDAYLLDTHADDILQLGQGEFAHGPLVGRCRFGPEPFYEARFSSKDFPQMLDHVAQDTPILPSAGYIEILLEAFEGTPLEIEYMELLQACPVSMPPLALQTKLDPVSTNEYAFTISSKTFSLDFDATVHCRGKVRLLSPERAASYDDVTFEEDLGPSERFRSTFEQDFYEELEASVGEIYRYGPAFKVLKEAYTDLETGDLIGRAEMDVDLWKACLEEGYVIPPELLDGGLQLPAHFCTLVTDFNSIPKMARDVVFLRKPSTPELIAHIIVDPEFYKRHELGQQLLNLGDDLALHIRLFDAQTKQLCMELGQYISFNVNRKLPLLERSKHVVSWQPKAFAETKELLERLPEDEISAADLLEAIRGINPGDRRVIHVAEFTRDKTPQETICQQCLEHLTGAETNVNYWIVSDSRQHATEHFRSFGNEDCSLRFVALDRNEMQSPNLDEGLLRESACELILYDARGASIEGHEFGYFKKLSVPSGLLLLMHDSSQNVWVNDGWRVLRTSASATLLQASSQFSSADQRQTVDPGQRVVIGEPGSLFQEWAHRISGESPVFIPWDNFENGDLSLNNSMSIVSEWHTVDLFFDRSDADPTGERMTCGFMAFIQQLLALREKSNSGSCRINVVTRGAAMHVVNPRAATVWGAVRTIVSELGQQPALDFRLIDIGGEEDLDLLADLLGRNLREREMSIRKGKLWVPRISTVRQARSLLPVTSNAAYRLKLVNLGQIDGLRMDTYDAGDPGPGEIEIDVVGAALNFRDVMVVMGLLPAISYERSALGPNVGMEGSGIVRRTGAEVSRFQPGDEVVFIAGQCIGNRIVVDQYMVFQKPKRLSFAEAAAAQTVYMTSYYALIQLANLRRGQRVLIHSAMGGVGHAALALAKHVGAEVYATAGSESKRRKLRELGVVAAFDSHSYSWHGELLKVTNGEGVDVILNSLAGDHIKLCLESLRPGGWHCEIGKIDIYADSSLSLRVFRKNLRFVAIDSDRLMLDDPRLSIEIAMKCLALLASGDVPALPVTEFSFGQYLEALRLMAAGKHVGKLVLMAPQSADERNFPVVDDRPFLDPEATYLLSGAMGGIGLLLIKYLAVVGARHVTLIDRDPKRKRDEAHIWKRCGLKYITDKLHVDILYGDVSKREDVQNCVAQLKRPLKGVFHLAGRIEDAIVGGVTSQSITEVFEPKASGALNLHDATRDFDLDHFVLFSSTASVFGNPAQSNYSAANAYLDALCSWRRAQGLPALAYNMSGVLESGMAARDPHVVRIMKASGIPPISILFAICNLDYALRNPKEFDHIISSVFERPPFRVNSSDFLRCGLLANNQDTFDVRSGQELTEELVISRIAEKIGELCQQELDHPDEPLAAYGLTSISVAELVAFINVQYRVQVSALELMTTLTARSLAIRIIHGQTDLETVVSQAGAHDQFMSDRVSTQKHRPPSEFANAYEDHFPATSR